jgi:uncharacterized protein (DUF4415 family)
MQGKGRFMKKKPVKKMSAVADHRRASKPLSSGEMKAARWIRGIDALPLPAKKAVKNSVGRPKKEHPKEKVTIRLDYDVLAALRATGQGWQTNLNAMLRDGLNI